MAVKGVSVRGIAHDVTAEAAAGRERLAASLKPAPAGESSAVAVPGRQEELRFPLESDLEKAVEDLNKVSSFVSKGLRFQLHEDSGRMMVKVIDSKTMEVIREIPPERVLEVLARIKDMIGLLLDERA